jgi:WD40 repeat protein
MKRQALVVGINQYPFGENQNLAQPAEDAEAVARLLEEYGDFEVQRLPCQDGVRRVDSKKVVRLEELEEAIIRLFHPKSGIIPEAALLFFAGHGSQGKKNGETEGFLVTSDALPEEDDSDDGLFSLKRLRQLLQDSPVRQQIVWLDCCHSGELFNFAETDLGEEKRGRDRCFIAASREFQVAFGQESGEHGELTGALLQGLDPNNRDDGWVTNYTLTDFIGEALKEAPQHPVLSNTGGQIILAGKQGVRGNICPYKGLEYFDFNPEDPQNAKDPKYFYGRTALTKQLLEKVREGNFLAVLGASGSGKSSVVRAGLLYQLYLGQVLPGSDRWKIYKPFTPGEHPLRSLEQVIGVKADQLESLIEAAATKRVVLVVDQFEEIFTQCRDDTERQQFFEYLMGAVERLGSRLWLMLVMRADFQGKCAEQEYAGLANKIDQNLVRVKQMNREELREAITQPAFQVGLEIDRELVTQMITDVEGSPGDLPLMQYTLTQLWEQRQLNRLTISDYTRLGGVKKALEKRANEVYESLSTEEQQVAKRIFLELTRIGEEDTRKQVRQQDLVNSQQSEALVNQVVQCLADAKLVVTGEQELEGKWVAVVNIAHEALIRNWQLLRSWLKENRDALLRKQDIEDPAKEWRDKGQPNESAYLLQGTRLATAEDYLQRFADTVPLSSLAQEFVHKSVKQRRNRRRSLVGTVTGVIVSLLGLTSWALIESEKFQIRADITSSEALFASNKELNALIQAIKAGRRLKQPLGAIGAKPDTRTEVVTALLKAIDEVTERNRLEGHSNPVNSVSFSPDGQIIATASDDTTVKLWNRDGTLLKTLKGHSLSVKSVSFSPDGQIIASTDNRGVVKLWNRDGTLLKTFFADDLKNNLNNYSLLNSVSFSPDSQTIVLSRNNGTVNFWSRKGTLLKTLNAHSSNVNDVSFSPDGQMIATAGEDKTVKLWSRNGKLLRTLELLKPISGIGINGVNSVSFSPDSQTVVAAAGDAVILWRRDGKLLETIVHPDSRNADGKIPPKGGYFISNVGFSPDGKTIAAASWDGTVKLWSRDSTGLKTFELFKTLKGHSDRVTRVSFSPDGKTLASASADTTVKLWDLNDWASKALRGHTSPVLGVSFSPDAQTIASVSGDNTVRLWNRNGTLLKTLEAPVKITESTGIGFSVSFSPDGQTVAATMPDKTVKLWSRDGTLLKILKPQPTQFVADSEIPTILSLSFSPDGKTIASGNSKGVVTLRSREGKLLKYFGVSMSRVSSLVFSPDSKTLAAAGASLTPETIILAPDNLKTSNAQRFVQLWKLDDISTECTPISQIGQMTRHESSVSVLPSNSPSANATCFAPTKSLKGHKNLIFALSFSPDGKMIASASLDKTVKIWNHNGTLLKTFKYKYPVFDVSFSPDGQRIVTANQEGLKLWNLSGQLMAEFGEKEQVSGVGIRLYVDEQTKTLSVNSLDENAPALRAGVKEDDRILEIDGKSTKGLSVDEAVKLLRGAEGTQVTLRISRKGSDASFNIPIIRATLAIPIPYRSVNFSPDGQIIVSGSRDTVNLWSHDGVLLKTLKGHGHPGPVNSVSFSRDGQTIVSASSDTTVKLWSRDGRLLKTIEGHKEQVNAVSFSQDGQTIASASDDKTVKLWSRDGKLLKTFDERSLFRQLDAVPVLHGVNFSPDGKIIAASGYDGTVKLWNENGTFIKTVQDGVLGQRSSSLSTSGNISDMSFSPDGSTIAATELDNTVKLYRRDGTLITTLQGHTAKVNSVSFSPDGQLIATASADNTVKLWNRNGTLRTTLTGHNDNIFSVSFSPDGQTIASASRDKTIKLWSRDGREIKTLRSRDFIFDVTFSPGSKMLAAASRDQTVHLWDLDLDVLLVKSCDLVHDYLKTNPNVSESDRHLCDGIETSR